MGPKTKGHRKGPGVVDCETKGQRKGHLVVECKSLLDIEVALVVPCRPAAGGVRVAAVGAAWPGSGWDCTGFRLGRGVSSVARAWGARLRAGVCWACVAAGSGFVVKPRASRALVGGGAPLGLGGPAARPTGWAGLAALWEIKKFFGGPRGCVPGDEISQLRAGTTWRNLNE